MNTDNTFEKNVNIEYDDQLLTQKISDLVLDMDGISRLTYSSITENVAKNVLKIDQSVQGIKINREDELINLEIHVRVFYGQNIPQLSYDIQTKVKKLIEELTGEDVKTVNISVDGIDRIKD